MNFLNENTIALKLVEIKWLILEIFWRRRNWGKSECEILIFLLRYKGNFPKTLWLWTWMKGKHVKKVFHSISTKYVRGGLVGSCHEDSTAISSLGRETSSLVSNQTFWNISFIRLSYAFFLPRNSVWNRVVFFEITEICCANCSLLDQLNSVRG